MHRSRPFACERGFTLTELLVALTVTVIGLAGLLSLHVTTVRGNASAARSAEAISIAEQTVEDLRKERVLQLEADYLPITAFEWPGFMLPIQLGRNALEYQPVIHAIAVPGSPGLVRLRIVVYWMDNGAAMPASVPQLQANADHALEVQMIRTRVEVL